jgi:plastocyanin
MDPTISPQQPTPDFVPAAPTSHKKWWLIGGVLVIAVLLVGGATWYFQSQAVDQESAETAPTAQVKIGKSLVPATIHVRQGQSVTWTNTTDQTHTLATKSDSVAVDGFGATDALKNGETYSYTFSSPGTYTYNDPLDPTHLSGTVIVQ